VLLHGPRRSQCIERLEIARIGPIEVNGVVFEALPTMESLARKVSPDENVIYHFELEGMSILHLGDLGNPLTGEQLDQVRRNVDVLLAQTGGPPAIEPWRAWPLSPTRSVPIRGTGDPVRGLRGREDPHSLEAGVSWSEVARVPALDALAAVTVKSDRDLSGWRGGDSTFTPPGSLGASALDHIGGPYCRRSAPRFLGLPPLSL
jgi:hypothetical protein